MKAIKIVGDDECARVIGFNYFLCFCCLLDASCHQMCQQEFLNFSLFRQACQCSWASYAATGIVLLHLQVLHYVQPADRNLEPAQSGFLIGHGEPVWL